MLMKTYYYTLLSTGIFQATI